MKVTLQDLFNQLPMGLGAYAPILIAEKLPSLAEKLDKPLKGITIDFEDGGFVPLPAASLLEQ